MNTKERVSIYVDGGNFHHLVLKKLGIKEQDFAFEDFAHFLIGDRKVEAEGKRFYVGSVREIEGNIRSKQAMSRQTRFFTTLNSYGWRIMTSKLRTRQEKIIIDERVLDYKKILSKGITEIEMMRTREKGIDVKLATDLIVGAVDSKYDVALVVSSDSDLIPAIDWIRRRKQKKVEYIGFSLASIYDPLDITKPTPSLIVKTDTSRIFGVADLKQFIKPFEQKSLFGNSE